MPPEIIILLTSMLPITELRATIPLALTVYNMPVWARTFYISKIVEFKEAERKAHDKEMKKAKSRRR